MDTYSLLREIADSWVLLGMVIFFVGVVLWAFRPGGVASQRNSAEIPFRHEEKPASDEDGNSPEETS